MVAAAMAWEIRQRPLLHATVEACRSSIGSGLEGQATGGMLAAKRHGRSEGRAWRASMSEKCEKRCALLAGSCDTTREFQLLVRWSWPTGRR